MATGSVTGAKSVQGEEDTVKSSEAAAQTFPAAWADQVHAGRQEPVAIVGMACRFPGADDLAAFWHLLVTGQNAITEGIPGSGVGRIGELFPDAALDLDACRFGAFVRRIDQFDAGFFRISPAEAQLLDPQQRLMLETCWHALEDAGIAPDQLQGSRAGVYAGISNMDYRSLILESSKPAEPATSLYAVTGTSMNTAIGRVAFVLGLEGPTMAVDTACSSSLVAMHQAIASLQRGETRVVLVGGVQALLSGHLYAMRAQAGMLAPDGKCKAFDASANGYVRGEGCGVVVLKRLEEAQADGDRIWGVIRGSAVNQDGASQGLTVPHEGAQIRVIEEALSRAQVEPAAVDYVEAHGTGTKVGDPIEMRSVAAAYGKGRPFARPLLVGSVKTNIGHLESAAGIAGLIKTVLAMRQGVIPSHLHFREPNPQLDWDQMPVQVATASTVWPTRPDHPPRAGLNSFGWSGTNAHVVVEGYREADTDSHSHGHRPWPAGPALPVVPSGPGLHAAPRPPLPAPGGRGTRFLPLSGKSEGALRELAGRYLAWLEERTGQGGFTGTAAAHELADMAWTAGAGRSHFSHRAGPVFQDVKSLQAQLRQIAADHTATSARTVNKVAFVYTGQGSQWLGMGKELYESEPVVRSVLDRCDEVLQADRGISLLDVMFGRNGREEELDDPAWTQPAIYALECALTDLWSSIGIRPSVVTGHSLGEIAAARTAGVFGLEDGLRFAAARGALMGTLSGAGAMAAVFTSVSRVAAAVEEQNATTTSVGLGIAAYNGTHQVVSGPAADVQAVAARFESEDVRVRWLRTGFGYHSAMVEPALDRLEATLAPVSISPPSLRLVSNVTGQVVESNEQLAGAYWRRHARNPVRFHECIGTLAAQGVEVVIEIGPHAVLGPMVTLSWPGPADSLPHAAGIGHEPPIVLQSMLRSSRDARPEGTFMEAVAGAYEAGLTLSFAGLFAGEERRRLALPRYPFQHQRHWIETAKRKRRDTDHPLLGVRHESPRGEVLFETELFASDPHWLRDHQVFGKVVTPGALYGAMAVAALWTEGTPGGLVEDLQLHSPMLLPDSETGTGPDQGGRKVQVVLDRTAGASTRRFEIYSRGGSEEGWTLHAEGRLATGMAPQTDLVPLDMEHLQVRLSARDVSALYQARRRTGIDFGAAFRSLTAIWSEAGEAVGEVALPDTVDRSGLEIHPILLDGCFQVLSAARNPAGEDSEATYMPFGWDRLWLTGPLPERMICHARMREADRVRQPQEARDNPPETLTGDLWFYSPQGNLLGGLKGYTVKRATREALLAAMESWQDLLYEVVWRRQALEGRLQSADFLVPPSAIAQQADPLSHYLLSEGVEAGARAALLADMDRLSCSFVLAALEQLGWKREAGTSVTPRDLRHQLNIRREHERLLGRMLLMLANAGILEPGDGGNWIVAVGSEDACPDEALRDPERLAQQVGRRHPHGSHELSLLCRCGAALAEVLQGHEDPLALLFRHDAPGAADLYRQAPASRAATRMLADAVATAVSNLPPGRKLRVLEVGAGTGSATSLVLPNLPANNFDYTFTDISAGFFAAAERQFADLEALIEYRRLDIETEPVAQDFDPHSYDLVIAANVLHATRHLKETLSHCRELLAPQGLLVALEVLQGRGWQDLTFGLLEGWWRFADSYRTQHALAEPPVWYQALREAGFGEAKILGEEGFGPESVLGPGVIVAQGPVEVTGHRGLWILTHDQEGVATQLARELVQHNRTVVLADDRAPEEAGPETLAKKGMIRVRLHGAQRESWRSLLEALPEDLPLEGIVHLAALGCHGASATTADIAQDARAIGASALALVQGLTDANATPTKGLWFITRGAQVVEREREGQLAGATLWGLGKSIAREAPQLHPRMLDLDPEQTEPVTIPVNELLFPDPETHIAYRTGIRQVARLVRGGTERTRLTLPDKADWRLAPDASGSLAQLQVEPTGRPPLQPEEVRVAVEATGLNFTDVLHGMGVLNRGLAMGREMCGRILEVGSDHADLSIGDRVVGLGFGTFSAEVVTRVELVAPAPSAVPAAALTTIPTAFTTAALAFEMAELRVGERVLIHAGTGGVGLAAIQLARLAGAEVYVTASAPKQAFLRSLGLTQVFDSRQTRFGAEILQATEGQGVHVVLNSLTGEGFIEANLSCLCPGGRFVEIGRKDIWSREEMASARPDIAYSLLELDVLKREDPARAGRILRGVMERLAAGELTPLVCSRWPLAEAGAAMAFMQSARHIGKVVLAPPPLSQGRLREDRTYLVTGGLGGIGCAVARWLVDHGAGAIVLNGRRAPGAEAEATIGMLRERGVKVQVELADVTDTDALDRMLAHIEETLPPLGGIIHSVGVLSDGALGNQSWTRFEQVLWPKVLGAWHLHRATAHCDLDLFVLFSSTVGVLGKSGQTNHAAANAFLDQLARHRQALGLPGQVIQWGAWSELGEAEEQRARISRQLAAAGVNWISPRRGMQAFDQLVRADWTSGTVTSVDWPVYAANLPSPEPFFEDLFSAAAPPAEDTNSTTGLLTQLRPTTETARAEVLTAFLQQELQQILRLPTLPDPAAGFFDLGLDSLMAVELRNRLNRAFADEYVASSTIVFDYPDITSLAHHLLQELAGDSDAVGSAEPRTPERSVPAQSADARIAIVGMACRFPGASDLTSFWQLLESGGNAVTDGRQDSGSWHGFVGDRASEDPVCRWGAFLEGLDKFDARFFRIPPIEARTMDPQQRLLLETSWQALEDAGIDPDGLKGTRTGVYTGISNSEYRDLMTARGLDINFLGTTGSVAAGRVAFTLGLEGPAMAVDQACASSLVAIHQAVTGLQRGDVDLALVGGVNAVLSPMATQSMAEIGLLSLQGVCRPFDTDADGFARGEGCGVVILKRLSEADGDRIWGTICGTAVNQNGASAGLTVPNGPAQERLIEEALAQAGLLPAEVDYLEAHATGSELGDSIEIQAAAAAYGRARDAKHPLLVGTVKANLGHLEAAAGIAGLIKVILAMQRRTIPGHIHFQNPNPLIAWDKLPVHVIPEPMDWPHDAERPPRAGISAFGISGTNAHVVVEGHREPDARISEPETSFLPAGTARTVPVILPAPWGDSVAWPADATRRKTRLLPLSAQSGTALATLATQYLLWLDSHPAADWASPERADALLADMAWTASVGRSHLAQRAAVVFDHVSELREQLTQLAESEKTATPAIHKANQVAFVFSDQGSQWRGMGKSLYASEPVARWVLDHCEQVMQELMGTSILAVMFGLPAAAGDLADPVWGQSTTFALACALWSLWQSVGIQPNLVTGQGVGELMAAHAAGMFSVAEGLRASVARGAVLAASSDQAETALQEWEVVWDEIELATPTIRMVSSLSGQMAATHELQDKLYWYRQAQERCEFGRSVDTLAQQGTDLVVEIAPQASLERQIVQTWPILAHGNEPAPASVLQSLQKPTDHNPQTGQDSGFVTAAAQAYEAGLPLTLAGLFAGEARRLVSVPHYPFQRQRYWIQEARSQASDPSTAAT